MSGAAHRQNRRLDETQNQERECVLIDGVHPSLCERGGGGKGGKGKRNGEGGGDESRVGEWKKKGAEACGGGGAMTMLPPSGCYLNLTLALSPSACSERERHPEETQGSRSHANENRDF